MLIVRATRKLLGLVGPTDLTTDDHDTTRLGPWHATVLPWRPRVALLVSESTLLPVLTGLTPAAGWSARIAAEVATVLAAHGAPAGFVADEVLHMGDHRLGPTSQLRDVVRVTGEDRGAAGERDSDDGSDATVAPE